MHAFRSQHNEIHNPKATDRLSTLSQMPHPELLGWLILYWNWMNSSSTIYICIIVNIYIVFQFGYPLGKNVGWILCIISFIQNESQPPYDKYSSPPIYNRNWLLLLLLFARPLGILLLSLVLPFIHPFIIPVRSTATIHTT